MLVVIGPRWLTASDRQGRRRLDLPADWVRQEIAEGLRGSGVRVFPVLVDGAEMPSEEELPEALRALARRQAFPLTIRHWRNDVEQFSEFLRTVPGLASTPAHRPGPGAPSPTRVPWKPLAAIGGVLALALLVIFSQAVPQHEKKPIAEAPNPPAQTTEAPKPSCSIAGTVFDKSTQRPLAGLIIGFIQYTEHKNAKEVKFNVATTGLNGAFKATCSGIAESDFPLRIVVRQLEPRRVEHWTEVKVELGDELTEVNLPMSLLGG